MDGCSKCLCLQANGVLLSSTPSGQTNTIADTSDTAAMMMPVCISQGPLCEHMARLCPTKDGCWKFAVCCMCAVISATTSLHPDGPHNGHQTGLTAFCHVSKQIGQPILSLIFLLSFLQSHAVCNTVWCCLQMQHSPSLACECKAVDHGSL